MTKTTIADALFTKTQQRVLALLYGRPGQSFYTNDIVRRAGMGRGTVTRELERLTSAGLIEVRRSGNQLHYQASAGNPVFQELVSLVKKTVGLADVIREALLPLGEQFELAFIYGSVAKSAESASSDIDVLLVSDSLAYADVMNVMAAAERELGRPINPTIYTREQLQARLQQGNAFLEKVWSQPKLWIKRDKDVSSEFGEFGKTGSVEKGV